MTTANERPATPRAGLSKTVSTTPDATNSGMPAPPTTTKVPAEGEVLQATIPATTVTNDMTADENDKSLRGSSNALQKEIPNKIVAALALLIAAIITPLSGLLIVFISAFVGAAWVCSVTLRAEFPGGTAICLLMTTVTFVYIPLASKSFLRLLDGFDGCVGDAK